MVDAALPRYWYSTEVESEKVRAAGTGRSRTVAILVPDRASGQELRSWLAIEDPEVVWFEGSAVDEGMAFATGIRARAVIFGPTYRSDDVLEACRRIASRDGNGRSRRSAPEPAGAVIVLSTFEDLSAKAAALTQGATDVIPMPARTQDVLTRLFVRLRPDAGRFPEAEPPACPPSGNALALVVEDEPVLSDLLFEVLTRLGCRVCTAATGSEALEMIRGADFRAVVADVHLPSLDGMALYRRACQLRPEISSRFLFMTGDLTSPEVRSFVDGLASRSSTARLSTPHCLLKPFKMRALITAAMEILRVEASS